jgi:hypothetical protein
LSAEVEALQLLLKGFFVEKGAGRVEVAVETVRVGGETATEAQYSSISEGIHRLLKMRVKAETVWI